MKALFVLVLTVVVVGGGLKLAGVPLPLIDYPVGPMGFEGLDPQLPRVEIEPPGYDALDRP